jgi:hypothetical protein
LAALVWLVVGSAVAFGVIRSARSAGAARIQWQARDGLSRALKSIGIPWRISDDLAVALIVIPITLLPVLFLFFRRRMAAMPRAASSRAGVWQTFAFRPASTLQERLRQFIAHVARVDRPAEPVERTVALPSSFDGKPARTRAEVSGPLGRIRDAVAAPSDADAK